MAYTPSEEQRAEAENIRLKAISALHDVNRLFVELSQEHLVVLRSLFNTMSNHPDGRIASYYEGVVTTALQTRFDICPTCGVNHMADAFPDQCADKVPSTGSDGVDEFFLKDEQPVEGPLSGTSGKDLAHQIAAQQERERLLDQDRQRELLAEEGPELNGATQPSMFESQTGLVWEEGEPNPLNLTDQDRTNMKLFHLEDAWNAETREFLGFKCGGTSRFAEPCGMYYVSIADRMLRAPDECHGCNQKGRWG